VAKRDARNHAASHGSSSWHQRRNSTGVAKPPRQQRLATCGAGIVSTQNRNGAWRGSATQRRQHHGWRNGIWQQQQAATALAAAAAALAHQRKKRDIMAQQLARKTSQ